MALKDVSQKENIWVEIIQFFHQKSRMEGICWYLLKFKTKDEKFKIGRFIFLCKAFKSQEQENALK